MSYDVFFSYNSQDRAAVEEIAPNFLSVASGDLWYLSKGQPWRPLLEQTLMDTRAVAIFIGPEGMGPWQHREVDVALAFQARNNGFPVDSGLVAGLRAAAWCAHSNSRAGQ